MKIKDYKDLPEEEILKQMEEHINKGRTCFIKWVCQGCNERVTCDTPNAFFTEGFTHTEKEDGTKCGFTSFPDKFGLVVMFKLNTIGG